jgi:hypothetical protein
MWGRADDQTLAAQLPNYAEPLIHFADFIAAAGASTKRDGDDPPVTVLGGGGHGSVGIRHVCNVEHPLAFPATHVPEITPALEGSFDSEGGLRGRVGDAEHARSTW